MTYSKFFCLFFFFCFEYKQYKSTYPTGSTLSYHLGLSILHPKMFTFLISSTYIYMYCTYCVHSYLYHGWMFVLVIPHSFNILGVNTINVLHIYSSYILYGIKICCNPPYISNHLTLTNIIIINMLCVLCGNTCNT